MKINLKQKLTSRKLWAAVVGVITGLSMVFGLDEGVVSTVAGAVTAIVSVISYIATEGKIDATRIANAKEATKEAIITTGLWTQSTGDEVELGEVTTTDDTEGK